ncbi:hypothetical protein M9458_013182, partial [Cirrhinus mrigala]
CTSKCVLSSGSLSGEFHQLRAMSAATPTCTHGSLEISATPTQYAGAFSMPPAVQPQSPATVSPVQNRSCTPVGHGVPIITGPICSVHQVGSVGPSVPLASSTGSSNCPSSAVLETQVPSQSQTNPNGPVLIICSDQEQEICSKESSKEGGTNTEDEHKDGMDTTPVRDISTEKLTVLTHKAKPTSPEKTAQKVMTVKYLLGELKTLVANQ